MNKKTLIYVSVTIIVFALLGITTFIATKPPTTADNNVTQNNPYGKKTLHPETIKLMNDPNYQNIILPEELDTKLVSGEAFTVYFFSPTCSHCKTTTPIISPIAKEKGVDLLMFNLLEFDQGWDKYKIDGTPTTVFYKDGKEISRIEGAQLKENFEKWFDKNK